ncbi:MAG: CNNM domain-containing protein [Sodalis sp. (in: enterobacteria)]|uniref:CNNM domain-containing protein n=1 Tax=Sodalis sp. (in: enterobacteria) TaxID=1898979 RepID=UPI003F3AE029
MKYVSTSTLLIILIIMVLVSAYFFASETGMMTLNAIVCVIRPNRATAVPRRVEKLLRRTDQLLSLVLIGNNLVNILASALATIVRMRLYGDLGVAIGTGVLTFVVLLFAEVLPKTVAALYPERIAFPSSLLLVPLQKLMLPIVWLLNLITRLLIAADGHQAPFQRARCAQ